MLSRALWTGLLALLAWIPIGRATVHAERTERALFVVSALDIATDSPARVGDRHDLPRQITTDRKPPTPRTLPRQDSDAEEPSSHVRSSSRSAADSQQSGWRGHQAKRLIAPHDATAPPQL
ncbi:MAG TPA: hypothetical protein VJO33_04130 [Gemmatimonadaceae bacterium]|nr:hypothetical protein [Gemmatimonadaceae bacterium]